MCVCAFLSVYMAEGQKKENLLLTCCLKDCELFPHFHIFFEIRVYLRKPDCNLKTNACQHMSVSGSGGMGGGVESALVTSRFESIIQQYHSRKPSKDCWYWQRFQSAPAASTTGRSAAQPLLPRQRWELIKFYRRRLPDNPSF